MCRHWRLLLFLLLSCFTVAIVNVFAENENVENLDVAKLKQGSTMESDDKERDGMSALLDDVRKSAKKTEFEADVNRMMKIIINSLYRNKEIFLRELLSNAADALEKIRFIAVTDKKALDAESNLLIRLKADRDAKTLTIEDTGVGMTEKELRSNLGTIAKSGTSEFLSNLKEAQNVNAAGELIGQFGVGFYSAFLVADRVTVVTKSNDDAQYIWDSDAESYLLSKDPRGNTIPRGTQVILHMKDEALDYLQDVTLKKIAKKYSQFVNCPIYVWASRTESVEEKQEASAPVDADSDVTVEDETKTETKTVEKTIWDWMPVNENKPIWTRTPSDVSEEEYTEFFKAFTGNQDEPLAKIHFSAEGEVSFKSILYIPKHARQDLYSTKATFKDNIKLYVRRIFIADNVEDLLPRYLAFVLGIVDSDDMPLNVSRETLQQVKSLKVIKRKLVRKVIEMLSKLSTEDYNTFWKEYAVSIKLGFLEDAANKSKLSKLLRFFTSHSETELQSLSDYVSRMKEKQKTIFFITGSSLSEIKMSPFVERILKKGYEIIYMTEPMDEYVAQSLPEFEGSKLQNVAKEGLILDDSAAAKETLELQTKQFQPLLDWLKDKALSGKIEKAELSQRLQNSPCALVAGVHGWSANLERIMLAQAYQRASDPTSNYYMNQKKILEINSRHPLIKELNHRIAADPEDAVAKEVALLLLDTATLRSGYPLGDQSGFASRIEEVMRKNLQVRLDEQIEEEIEDGNQADASTESPATDFATELTDEEEASTDCPACRKMLGLHGDQSGHHARYADDDEDGDDNDDTGDEDDDNDDDIVEDDDDIEDDDEVVGDDADDEEDTDENDDYDDEADENETLFDADDESFYDETEENEGDDVDDETSYETIEALLSEEDEDDDDDNDDEGEMEDIAPTSRKLLAVKKESAVPTKKPLLKVNSATVKDVHKTIKKVVEKVATMKTVASKKKHAKSSNAEKKAKSAKSRPKKTVTKKTVKKAAAVKPAKLPVKKKVVVPAKSAMKKVKHTAPKAPVHAKPQEPRKVPRTKVEAEKRLVGTFEDHDCDGIPDDIDEDVDNDGLLDRTQDSDWDGMLNHIDDDDDNDGILDIYDEDSNGDGIPDCRHDTSDNQLVMRFKKKRISPDSDMDGIPDDFDLDDDGDGIPDILEDEDGDQIPDFLQVTVNDNLFCGKGVLCMKTMEDIYKLNKKMAERGWSDRDCDGIPDHMDPDDDNDGYFDNKQDSDRDGILNEYDDDDDNDGIPDLEDPDANGDGVIDCVIKDSDGDGIPDHIDTDDDNDGIPDLKDPKHILYNFFKDSDHDGIPDSLDHDDDNDGIPDYLDDDADGDGQPDFLFDSDADGVPDTIDDDMNNDGIPDHLQDHDCDGIPDVIDPDDDNDGYFDNKQDSDNDGILNEWDDDDDNDGIPDWEDEDSNGDGIIDCQPRDSDGDGIPDHLDDDDDNDGIPDHLDPDSMAFLLYKPKRLEAVSAHQAREDANNINVDLGDTNDKDCDGIPDDIDEDIDNDGKIDRTQDSDWDGELNHIDDDDDNDGIPDYLDADANGDGIPDCRRDDEIKYRVIRTFGGIIKKVLRIRKPTKEEEALDRQKEAVEHRLHRIRALKEPHKEKSKPPAPARVRPGFAAAASVPPVAKQHPAKPKKQMPIKAVKKKPAAKPKAVKAPKDKSVHPTKQPKVLMKLDGIPAKGKVKSQLGQRNLLYATFTDDIDDDEVEEIDEESEDNDEFEVMGEETEMEDDVADDDEATEDTSEPELEVTDTNEGVEVEQDEIVDDDDDDNDGVKDHQEDEDQNQKLDILEAKDSDGDGIPDYIDDDDDNDGIPDIDDDDDDGDGIPDTEEDENKNSIPDYLEGGDTDSDGISDLIDTDDDNDGIPDYLDDDANGDGIPDKDQKAALLNKLKLNWAAAKAQAKAAASLKQKSRKAGSPNKQGVSMKMNYNNDDDDDDDDNDIDLQGKKKADLEEENRTSKIRGMVSSVLRILEGFFGVQTDD